MCRAAHKIQIANAVPRPLTRAHSLTERNEQGRYCNFIIHFRLFVISFGSLREQSIVLFGVVAPNEISDDFGTCERKSNFLVLTVEITRLAFQTSSLCQKNNVCDNLCFAFQYSSKIQFD